MLSLSAVLTIPRCLQRNDVPADLQSATGDSIDPTTWGTPSAAWPAASCNISNFFTPQQLVIDVTLCGDLCVPLPPPSALPSTSVLT